MWRNFHEDWERRKTYLIRSLFQDIPVLSPVPEGHETEYDAISPSDVPPSRPYSPLPPLIIERVPNRHDHPDQFYEDLERKMKKLYRKLFFNIGCSSIEDLIESYGQDFDVTNEIDHIGTEFNDIGDVCHNIRDSDTHYEKEPLFHDIENHEALSSSSKYSSKDSRSRQSKGAQSSTQSLCATQVTIVADVHGAPTTDRFIEETMEGSTEEETIVISPILKLRRLQNEEDLLLRTDFRRNGNEEQIGQLKQTQSENKESEKYKETNEADDPGHNNEEPGSEIRDPEEDRQGSDGLVSNESIELMRRQANISSPLDSLPEEPNNLDDSELSMTFTDINFQTKLSLEKNSLNSSTENEISNGSKSFPGDLIDDITLEHSEESQEIFYRKASRRRIMSSDEKTPSVICKRKKHENIAIQTSVNEDRESVIDWNQLKNSFFVGVPKIYKLCSCKDHFCSN